MNMPIEVYEPHTAWLEDHGALVLMVPRWPKLQGNWVVYYRRRYYRMLRKCLSRQRGEYRGYYVQCVTPVTDGPVSSA